jgi:histidyl-tRNA synthetase
VVSRIDLNPMRAFDATDRGTRRVMEEAPKLLDRLAPEDAEHFAEVRRLLDGAQLRYVLDPALVRGLDYYTRTLFEFTSDALGAQSGVAGGGRYDRLIEQLDGPPTPASGWAAGVERILLATSELPVAPDLVDLYVAHTPRPPQAEAAFDLALQARRAGLQAQLELAGRSIKGQLKHADRLGARYVAIVGEDGHASLRDMQSGEQRELELQSVIPTILRGSRLA